MICCANFQLIKAVVATSITANFRKNHVRRCAWFVSFILKKMLYQTDFAIIIPASQQATMFKFSYPSHFFTERALLNKNLFTLPVGQA